MCMGQAVVRWFDTWQAGVEEEEEDLILLCMTQEGSWLHT